MVYTGRGVSGLCCQPGKLFQSGAEENLGQLSSEEVERCQIMGCEMSCCIPVSRLPAPDSGGASGCPGDALAVSGGTKGGERPPGAEGPAQQRLCSREEALCTGEVLPAAAPGCTAVSVSPTPFLPQS